MSDTDFSKSNDGAFHPRHMRRADAARYIRETYGIPCVAQSSQSTPAAAAAQLSAKPASSRSTPATISMPGRIDASASSCAPPASLSSTRPNTCTGRRIRVRNRRRAQAQARSFARWIMRVVVGPFCRCIMQTPVAAHAIQIVDRPASIHVSS